MKFNIEAEASPEEVRRLLGLPDLTEVHAVYLDRMKDTMTSGLSPDMVEGMVRNWMPGGAAGMDLVRDLMSGIGAASGKGKKG
jgi:Family of unknown function (DUF6489)